MYTGIRTTQLDLNKPYQSSGQEKGAAVFDLDLFKERALASKNPKSCIGVFNEEFYLAKHGDPLVGRCGYSTKAKKPMVTTVINGASLKDYPDPLTFYKQNYVVGIQSGDKPFITDVEFAPIIGGDIQIVFKGQEWANEDVCVVLNPTYQQDSRIGTKPGWEILLETNKWHLFDNEQLQPSGKIGYAYVPYRQVKRVLKSKPFTLETMEAAKTSLLERLSPNEKNEYKALGVVPKQNLRDLLFLYGKTRSIQTKEEEDTVYYIGGMLINQAKSDGADSFISGSSDQDINEIDRILEGVDGRGYDELKNKFGQDTATLLKHYVVARNRKENFMAGWVIGRLLQDATDNTFVKLKIRE